MNRRDFLYMTGQLSAMMLVLRETGLLSSAYANNIAAPEPVGPVTAQQVSPPPAPVTEPVAPPTPAPVSELPFSEQWFYDQAKMLSTQPFQDVKAVLPDELKNFDYDQYRYITFKKNESPWQNDPANVTLEMFHAGYIYNDRVTIHLVENGVAREFRYSPSQFNYGPKIKAPPLSSDSGFSGFRIHAPINRRDVMDEFVVFQGASYLRSFAVGQGYGISARGLAINTAQPPGEEFPIFKSFWVEKPQSPEDPVIVYAMLDSVSTTGAFKYIISSVTDTVMEVDSTLYPRAPMSHVGIAPLTSMFFAGTSDLTKYTDYRPRIYDSEGLQMLSGRGETIWRPLINPERLQFSIFEDENPKGFGLTLRERNFSEFQDLGVRYELRPSLWIEPLDDWGKGYVDLIELPTPTEYNDNIVAYWRPKDVMEPGKSYRYRYRMTWCYDPPVKRNYAYVTQTRVATAPAPGWHSFHLDFANTEGYGLCHEFDELCADKHRNLRLSCSKGVIGQMYFQPNKLMGGHRLSFDFQTRGLEQADLRCVLVSEGKPVSETWLYRWTA